MSKPSRTLLGNLGKDFGAVSKSVEWETPLDLFAELDQEFKFTIDVCASDLNAKCERYYTKDVNGLKQSWANERAYMNPPYGKDLADWVEKAKTETDEDCEVVVGLLPVRSSNKWFHKSVLGYADIWFIEGRLKFNNEKSCAPFGSMIVIWSKDKKEDFEIISYKVGTRNQLTLTEALRG